MVRHVAGIFVVMTSLVLGLMITSAKNTFEGIDHNVHALATQLIILDRALQQYGPETAATRAALVAYVGRALYATWPSEGRPIVADKSAEKLLRAVGDSLGAVRPQDERHALLWNAIQQQYQKVVEQRWVLVEQSEGAIPRPLIAMLAAWLVLIFAGSAFCAPRNPVVIGTFVLSAGLFAGTIYLILDMDVPFAGPIRISPAPLERVLEEMRP